MSMVCEKNDCPSLNLCFDVSVILVMSVHKHSLQLIGMQKSQLVFSI